VKYDWARKFPHQNVRFHSITFFIILFLSLSFFFLSFFLPFFLSLTSVYLLIAGVEGYCCTWSQSTTYTHSVGFLWTSVTTQTKKQLQGTKIQAFLKSVNVDKPPHISTICSHVFRPLEHNRIRNIRASIKSFLDMLNGSFRSYLWVQCDSNLRQLISATYSSNFRIKFVMQFLE
jgi:hypothetical protein